MIYFTVPFNAKSSASHIVFGVVEFSVLGCLELNVFKMSNLHIESLCDPIEVCEK